MAEPIARPNRVGVTKLTGRWQLTVEDGNASVSCAGPCEPGEHDDAELVDGLPLWMDPIPVDVRVEVDDESGDWGEGALSAWLVAVPQAVARIAELERSSTILRQALEWYGDKDNYVDLCPGQTVATGDGPEFVEDEGHCARVALAAAAPTQPATDGAGAHAEPLPDDAHPEPEDRYRAPSECQRCRGGRHCPQPPVADIARDHRRALLGRVWYGYCAEHLRCYNREVRDGRVWWLGTVDGECFVHTAAGGGR